MLGSSKTLVSDRTRSAGRKPRTRGRAFPSRTEEIQAQKNPAPAQRWSERGRVLGKDSGDDRLSRQGHYHGPGGLNGRVRDGNGCGPASIVAGKPAGRRSGRPAAGNPVSDHAIMSNRQAGVALFIPLISQRVA